MTELSDFSTFEPDTSLSVWNPVCQPNAPLVIYLFWFLLADCSLFNIIFGVYAIIRSAYSTSPDKIFIMIYICFMLNGIVYSYHIGQSMFCLSDFYEWMIVGTLPSVMYMCGLSLVYLLYLLRLRSIFNTTEYALSTWLYIIYLILFIIQMLLPCFMAYYFLNNMWSEALTCYSTFLITNLIANILLLSTFGRKIYILGAKIVDTNDYKTYTMTANENETTINSMIHDHDHSIITSKTVKTKTASSSHSKSKIEDQRDAHLKLKTLLTPSIRYILCAFIAMASSNILSILGFYRSSCNCDNGILWIIHLFTMRFDECINMICLYLQYNFADKKYRKCCSKIHLFIYNILVKKFDEQQYTPTIQDEEIQFEMDNIDDNLENIEITLLEDTYKNKKNDSNAMVVNTKSSENTTIATGNTCTTTSTTIDETPNIRPQLKLDEITELTSNTLGHTGIKFRK
eukprot:200505_1